MALSLNLTVGILGELSLGHAGFMSVGAFSGAVAAAALQNAIPSPGLRLAIALLIGAVFAGVVGTVISVPVLRLNGDYLAIVTLAFGQIIMSLIKALQINPGIRIIGLSTTYCDVTEILRWFRENLNKELYPIENELNSLPLEEMYQVERSFCSKQLMVREL